jgi:hypothetical protein
MTFYDSHLILNGKTCGFYPMILFVLGAVWDRNISSIWSSLLICTAEFPRSPSATQLSDSASSLAVRATNYLRL